MKKHELLAPAGSLEICKAVITAGADAVYLGGEKYGARAFAQNFSRMEVLAALDYAHLYGRKIFLTVNTLLKNKEQGEELYSYIQPYYERGLDAVIVQDYGVFQFLKRNFPDLPLHVSTQASVSNVYGTKFFLEQGAARIVPSRELSLPEIRRIYDETGAELECFVHGALCYSYSGQCLMSSLLGGRSGNRGRCAQPCRLAYDVIDEDEKVLHKKEKYPLSPKDLNTLEILPKLCEAGIYSFKIEGRMKSLEYAAGVTSVYRRYLDLYERASEKCEESEENMQWDSNLAGDVRHEKKYAAAREDLQYLFDLGNRSGFTRGYYEMRCGRAMMTLAESKHTSANAKEAYRPVELGKIPVSGRVEMRVGERMRLELCAVRQDERNGAGKNNRTDNSKKNKTTCIQTLKKEDKVVVLGAQVSMAQNRPLTAGDVRARFFKTGDTPFEMKDLEVVLDGGCFVPVGQMNGLRRQGLALLQEEMLAPYQRNPVDGELKASKVRMPEQSFSDQNTADGKLSAFLNPQSDSVTRICVKENATIGGKSVVPRLNVWVSNPEQLKTALDFAFVDMVTLDFSDIREAAAYRKRIIKAGKRAAFVMPHVFRENSSEIYSHEEYMDVLSDFDLIWVRTYDELGFFLRNENFSMTSVTGNDNLKNDALSKIALDDHLYVFSKESADAFLALGVNCCTASPELNRKELMHMPNAWAEFPVYGYAPMMISAQCVYKNYSDCWRHIGKNQVHKNRGNLTAGGKLFLRDRYFKKFFIYRNCASCYNVIYNSHPLYLLHQADEVKKLGFCSHRITFTREDTETVRQVLADYGRAFLNGVPINPPQEDFTTGHFRRGVE